MIATLEGIVSEKIEDTIVIVVSGVGYGVLMTAEDFGKLQPGKAVKVYVYEHIRESAHDLYAFTSRPTKQLFELLLTVNGVGPRMALNVLSIGASEAVKTAIASGDTKFIQQAAGVGKRVAERVVVDLKDKVGLSGVDLTATGLLQSEMLINQDEAAAALMSLGYTATDAARALDGIDLALPTDERIKQALKGKV